MQFFIPMLVKSANHFIMFVADLKKKDIFYLDNRITDDEIGTTRKSISADRTHRPIFFWSVIPTNTDRFQSVEFYRAKTRSVFTDRNQIGR